VTGELEPDGAMNHEDKTMLALVALTYRGFGHHSEAVIARKLDPWLPALEAEGLGRWKRVWGPATFRAPTSLVDDAMMYAAKREDLPGTAAPHYVIAIRGTNPLSLFDWVFGDLWVRHQIDWPGSPDARLSASTALGLAVVQGLTATEPPSNAGNFAPLANGLSSALQGFARRLPELIPEEILANGASFSDADLIARIRLLSGAAGEELRLEMLDRVFDHFETAGQPLRDALHGQVFQLLRRHIGDTRGQGHTIFDFLNRVVEDGARVTLVGHSKGGALAVAASLWLAETWASGRNVAIDCFSFAGPTGGNAPFAAHYDAVLAPKTRSIVNRRDIVPHAWAISDLNGIGDLYPLLDFPTNALAGSVTRFGYTHVGGERIVFTPPPGPRRNLVQELIYNHLDAYLVEAGLTGPRWNALSIFLQR
jgi:hypothetical protein